MTEPSSSARTPVCWPTIWGDAKRDHRRRYTRHDFILQPFYNQDFRVWCRRCGRLTTEADRAA